MRRLSTVIDSSVRPRVLDGEAPVVRASTHTANVTRRPVRRFRAGPADGGAAQGRNPRQPAGSAAAGAAGAHRASCRASDPRRTAAAPVGCRHVCRLRAGPERGGQTAAVRPGRFGRHSTVHRDAAATGVPVHRTRSTGPSRGRASNQRPQTPRPRSGTSLAAASGLPRPSWESSAPSRPLPGARRRRRVPRSSPSRVSFP